MTVMMDDGCYLLLMKVTMMKTQGNIKRESRLDANTEPADLNLLSFLNPGEIIN